jgi:hypothetical protein
MKIRRELARLERAVVVNTSRPDAAEMKKIKVRKKILTSLKLEGDSKLGMILFVGVAESMGMNKDHVIDFLGLEFAGEYDHKLNEFSKYKTHEDEDIRKRFANKIKLINNYLILN